MDLIGNSQIDGDELKQYLIYFEAVSKAKVFEHKETSLWEDALHKQGFTLTPIPPICAGAKRFSQAAEELLRQLEGIKNIPAAATTLHHAWHEAFTDYAGWARATAEDIKAMAEGKHPNMRRGLEFFQKYRKTRDRANAEEKKFLKLLRISEREIAEIETRSITTIANNDWAPNIE